MNSTTSRSNSTKPPEKPDEGFTDDPRAEEADKHGAYYQPETIVPHITLDNYAASPDYMPYHARHQKGENDGKEKVEELDASAKSKAGKKNESLLGRKEGND
tara:strand:- start:3243 stop:3548 length:306 start_codon:yes stop_codon:yes gene_type:complete